MDIKKLEEVREALEAGQPVMPMGFFLDMLRIARDMGLVKRTRYTTLDPCAKKGTEGKIWNYYSYSGSGLFVSLARGISVRKYSDEPWAVERTGEAPFDPLDRRNEPGPLWDDLNLLIDGFATPFIVITDREMKYFPDRGDNELAEYVSELFPPVVEYPRQLMDDELAGELGVCDDMVERYDQESGRWVRCE